MEYENNPFLSNIQKMAEDYGNTLKNGGKANRAIHNSQDPGTNAFDHNNSQMYGRHSSDCRANPRPSSNRGYGQNSYENDGRNSNSFANRGGDGYSGYSKYDQGSADNGYSGYSKHDKNLSNGSKYDQSYPNNSKYGTTPDGYPHNITPTRHGSDKVFVDGYGDRRGYGDGYGNDLGYGKSPEPKGIDYVMPYGHEEDDEEATEAFAKIGSLPPGFGIKQPARPLPAPVRPSRPDPIRPPHPSRPDPVRPSHPSRPDPVRPSHPMRPIGPIRPIRPIRPIVPITPIYPIYPEPPVYPTVPLPILPFPYIKFPRPLFGFRGIAPVDAQDGIEVLDKSSRAYSSDNKQYDQNSENNTCSANNRRYDQNSECKYYSDSDSHPGENYERKHYSDGDDSNGQNSDLNSGKLKGYVKRYGNGFDPGLQKNNEKYRTATDKRYEDMVKSNKDGLYPPNEYEDVVDSRTGRHEKLNVDFGYPDQREERALMDFENGEDFPG